MTTILFPIHYLLAKSIFFLAFCRNIPKVLIIDDDTDLLQLTRLIFKKAGFLVFTASDGLEGISTFFMHHPDLIILDIMMPGSSGFEVCERIRKVSDNPIIFLTALNDEQDMLRGLAIGADDFLSKPVNPEILVARAKTILRRIEAVHLYESMGDLGPFIYNDGYLSIDIEKHEVSVHGNRVKLTPREFALLVYLARNGGKLLTFDKILTNVWGSEYQGNVDQVHVYISHLRKKLEEDSKIPNYIKTIHGIGYIFEKHELGYQAGGF